MLPMIENAKTNDTEERHNSEKDIEKSSLFGAWPGGLREALTITTQSG